MRSLMEVCTNFLESHVFRAITLTHSFQLELHRDLAVPLTV